MVARILHQRTGTVLADRAVVADRPWSRMRGLLGRKTFLAGEALLIRPCSSVHMFFMRFAIDIVFLDPQYRAVGLLADLRPWTVSPVFWKAHSALELPAGTLSRADVRVGDILTISFQK